MPLTDDLIAETTVTTGTGTVDLGGAQTGYSRFRDFHADGARVGYVIQVPGGDFERGIGRLIYGATDTLTRDVVLVSSNADTALVDFPVGTKQLTGSFQTAVGSRLAAIGLVHVHRNGTDQTITAATDTKIAFTNADHDDDGVFDLIANLRYQPTLPGIYRLQAQASMEGEANTLRQLWLLLNGTTVISRHIQRPNSANPATLRLDVLRQLDGGADYVEVLARINGTGSKVIDGEVENTYFEAYRVT